MKRYGLGLVVLALVLALGSMAYAVFPTPDSTATFTVQQGCGPTGQTVWYFCTDTNSIGFASTNQFPFRQMTLAPPLASTYNPTLFPPTPGGAAQVYFNTCAQQCPIFSALPGGANYSGKWSVVFINWLPGQGRRVCNLQPFDAVTNPFGFPILSGPNQQATLSSSYGTIQTGAVIDCPIVAVGPFPVTGPWFGTGNNSNPAVFYRLPQVVAFNAYFKTVTLPAFYVYCQEMITNYIDRCTLIIPDVSSPIVAAKLKANLAPGLVALDAANSQDFDFISGKFGGTAVPPPWILGGPLGQFRTPNQYPIISECPTGHGTQQANPLYTPFMHFDELITGPAYPMNGSICFVNNNAYAEMLQASHVFIGLRGGFINAPVLDCTKILPPGGQCCLPGP